MNRCFLATYVTSQLIGTVGNHLIHIHIALSATAALPDGQRELLIMPVTQHFVTGRDYQRGLLSL
jgi:hypothetical protein